MKWRLLAINNSHSVNQPFIQLHKQSNNGELEYNCLSRSCRGRDNHRNVVENGRFERHSLDSIKLSEGEDIMIL